MGLEFGDPHATGFEDPVERRLSRLPKVGGAVREIGARAPRRAALPVGCSLVVEPQLVGQSEDDVEVRTRLTQRLDDRSGVDDVLLRIAAQLAPFERRAGGEDDIGMLGAVGEEEVDVHDEVQLVDGGEEAFGVGPQPVVHAESHQSPQGIRLPGGYLPGDVHRLAFVHHLRPYREAGLRPGAAAARSTAGVARTRAPGW